MKNKWGLNEKDLALKQGLDHAIYELDYEGQHNRHIVCFYRAEFGAARLLIAGSYVYWGTTPQQVYP